MKLRDILQSKSIQNVLTIAESRTVHEAIRILSENKIGALLVLDKNEALVGIISERDVLWECVERDNLLRKTKVRSVMTKKLITGSPEDDIEHTMGIMTQNRIRHLPILEGERVVGIISIGDVVKGQLTEMADHNQYLTQYMFHS
jgi:CBS domain-containing protein